MKALLRVIRQISYLSLGFIDRVLGKKSKHIILCYHAIDADSWVHAITASEFRNHMRTLQTLGYAFVSLSALIEQFASSTKVIQPTVTITFDDGYRSILSVCDIVREFGIRPTVFVTDEDNKNDLPIEMKQRNLLSLDELGYLKSQGWEIGYHTKNHMRLSSLTITSLRKQVRVQNRKLESLFTTPKSIAYPYGDYTKSVIKEVKNAGFSYGLTMDDGVLDQHVELFRIPRIGVDSSHTLVEFPAIFSPTVIRLRALAKKFGLGVFFG